LRIWTDDTPAAGLRGRFPAAARPLSVVERRDSALAKNYFKPKMICETALPGVLDIDLKPFIAESEGR
jgi:hypothetical protein